jgi:hypothetical protein
MTANANGKGVVQKGEHKYKPYGMKVPAEGDPMLDPDGEEVANKLEATVQQETVSIVNGQVTPDLKGAQRISMTILVDQDFKLNFPINAVDGCELRIRCLIDATGNHGIVYDDGYLVPAGADYGLTLDAGAEDWIVGVLEGGYMYMQVLKQFVVPGTGP